jgi:hypothetical protein
MLLSPVVLSERIGAGLPRIPTWRYERLRDAQTAFLSGRESERRAALLRFADAVLEEYLDLPQSWWQKHSAVEDQFTVISNRRGGHRLRPDRVLLAGGDPNSPRLLVLFDPGSQRLGIGRSRQVYADLVELLRGTDVPVGLMTNGEQFRLVYAGLDFDCSVEWEVARWFEDALGREQLGGFATLCGRTMLLPDGDEAFPLLAAITESRSRQGELSQVLGEQTRRAVELLLEEVDRSCRAEPALLSALATDPGTGRALPEAEANGALYQASIRVVMRLVVSLFAEARYLLPVENGIYYGSYGVEGLFAQLRAASASEGPGLFEQEQAWPRLLALFRLIAEGSDLADLPLPAYGGALFAPGDSMNPDPVRRALAVLEDDRCRVTDGAVFDLLKLLKIGRVKVRAGRANRYVSGAVDFLDLRTEYIGMMYEGLLDYELRTVRPEEDAVVFLRLGIEPALPFSFLRSLSDPALRSLLTKLGKETAEKKVEGEGSGDGEEVESADGEEPEIEEAAENEPDEEMIGPGGAEEATRDAVLAWAEHAASLQGRRGSAGQQLIRRDEILLPGRRYLVRSSGTRKGSGTFYTKPQLAVPTVHRTLEPLVYETVTEKGVERLVPRTPEAILALAMVDPAMGSGSFLVGGLRYLADALYESLWHHGRIRERSATETVVTLPLGAAAAGGAEEELLPCRPDDERFEPMLKARLKRYVVERCIYGVDLNPLAVELGKLALWVETMDRELPFEFLDHKLKVGNSLVGCWFDRFTEYPVMAWMREGGDKGHNGVHVQGGAWTAAIKATLADRVKPELVRLLEGQQDLGATAGAEAAARAAFEKAVRRFATLHALPIAGERASERERFFQECIVGDEEIGALRAAFDRWCAVWFWPVEWLDDAALTPAQFAAPSPVVLERVLEIAARERFFHWELEFPEVFVTGKGGFDAVVGNPPWEIAKPKSQEFFSRHDPVYRTYGKQEAISVQRGLFEREPGIELAWLEYSASFKAMSNFVKFAAMPFGDYATAEKPAEHCALVRGNAGKVLHDRWRARWSAHASFADPAHPFQYQGSADLNTYKLFLELGHALCRDGGRLGMIVPSGIYTDMGTAALRSLFLDACQWQWVWCLINWNKLFPSIYYRFKFAPIIVQKGNSTTSIRGGFNKKTFESWENAECDYLVYTHEQIERLSPKSRALLEVSTPRDLAIVERMYENAVLLGDQGPDGWGIQYACEFHMTNDSHLFPPRTWWEERGYWPDPYGRWLPPEEEAPALVYKGREIGPAGDVALPLYEGRMIGQFDFSQKGWVSGKGRSAVWRDIAWEKKVIEPQFLLPQSIFNRINSDTRSFKLGMMDVTSATNARTTIVASISHYLCGHKVPTIIPQCYDHENIATLGVVMDSIAFDYLIRYRLGGQSLILGVLLETPFCTIKPSESRSLSLFGNRLAIPNIIFSDIWFVFQSTNQRLREDKWTALFALTTYERLRLRCTLDAAVAKLYGLSHDDFAWILRDCGWPVDEIRQRSKEFDPKGFWRVDKDQDPELRHTVLALRAFADLEEVGLEVFLAGDGWQIPETITYAILPDGTIAFDTPDGMTVSVRERLGPRYLDWQLEGTPEGTWAECERHARTILGEEGFAELQRELGRPVTYAMQEEQVGAPGSSAGAPATGVAEVLRWAAEQEQQIEEKRKQQRTLEEW